MLHGSILTIYKVANMQPAFNGSKARPRATLLIRVWHSISAASF